MTLLPNRFPSTRLLNAPGKSTACTLKHLHHQLLLQSMLPRVQNSNWTSLLRKWHRVLTIGFQCWDLWSIRATRMVRRIWQIPTNIKAKTMQATFLFLSRQHLAWWRKASARNVQHHQLPTSSRFTLLNLCVLLPIISDRDVTQFFICNSI